MIIGYDKPLYILPFDHRHSYITGVFHWQEPLARHIEAVNPTFAKVLVRYNPEPIRA